MTTVPKIFGLVLSGGKSSRMGKDKGLIPYHGVPQREYLYHLLNKVCERTFISLRKDQQDTLPSDMEIVLDEDNFKGPYNGLLSAHSRFPEVAWLVLACDLPLMDLQSLQHLITSRNTNSVATAFAQKSNPLPEPLCAIWEPKGLENSLAYLKTGNGTCPRKFLINGEVELVFPNNPNVLLNANSEEEYKEALVKLETT